MMHRDRLTERLETLRSKALRIRWSASLAWSLLVLVLMFVGVMWLDLMLELSAAFRQYAVWIVVLTAGVLVAYLGLRYWIRIKLSVIARDMDQQIGTGGEIRSGLDLLSTQQQRHGLAKGLAEVAIIQANKLIWSIPLDNALTPAPAYRAWKVAGVAGAVLLVCTIIMPRLAATQLARLFDPHGDHPPYARNTFEIDPGDVGVVYGQPQKIVARVFGPAVDEVELVLVDQQSQDQVIVPMFPDSEKTWMTTLAEVTQSGRYFVRSHRARSHRYDLVVITVPQLTAARFKVTPPSYTAQRPYEGPLPQGGLSGLPGTKVEVALTSNRPLSGGTGRMKTDTQTSAFELSPQEGDPNTAIGSFVIDAPGELECYVSDVEGQQNRDPVRTAVSLLEDHRPFVRLLEPQAISLATPDADIPVVVAGEDDYGITSLQLFRSLNDSPASALQVELPDHIMPQWRSTETLPLSAYGLSPGDEISLFGRVVDNDPAQPKGSESEIATIRIISQRELERLMRRKQGLEMLESKYAQADRRMDALLSKLEALKKELEAMPADEALSQSQRDQLKALAREAAEVQEALEKAAAHELPYDLDQAMSNQLKQMAQQFKQASRELDQMSQSPNKQGGIPRATGTAEELEKLCKSCRGCRKQFDENATTPMEHLADIYPLLEDEARFLQLYQRQKNLSQRLKSLKDVENQDDPAAKRRMRDLETEQRQQREALQTLLDDIEEHVSRLSDDERLDDLRRTSLEFARGVRTSGAAQAMASAEEGLAEFSGTRGYRGASEAVEILDEFIERAKGMGGQGQAALRFQPTLSAGLGNTVDQLLSDAGLSGAQPSSGQGKIGSGGGYSASRTSLDNVGMYGNLPTMGDVTQSGQGGRDGKAGGLAHGMARPEDANEPWQVGMPGELKASGAANPVVPVKYRTSVGAYFERVADETANK
jgi:hypothetical protein